MKKYKRVIPRLTDLDPSDVSEIFSFLKSLFEVKLRLDHLQEDLYKHTLYQQYFIVQYGKQYFNLDNTNSYLSKRLYDLEQDIESQDEEDAFIAYKEVITTNNLILQKKLNLLEKNIINRVRYYLKHGIQSKLSPSISETVIDKKIPVYLKSREFKKIVYKSLKALYSEQQIDDFYINSFKSSTQSFPPKLLYLEIENSSILYAAIYSLFNYKFKYVSENLRTLNSKYNYKVSKMPLVKQKFYSELKTDKVTRYDFMCIMFNAFPQIRDTYYKALKQTPSLTLKDYLTTKSRNIRA
ncbi:MAG: hypothetical protein Wins2KO_22270 [Winogradskyella sp.]